MIELFAIAYILVALLIGISRAADAICQSSERQIERNIARRNNSPK